MELAASATESVEGQPAKIISVPWKIPASASGEGQQPEDKAEKEPATYPLDIMSSQDPDSEYTTFPFSWRRLQFRNATANNGRRKELQQHYTLKLTIYATLSTGHKIALCDAVSGPVIVRGRSPRNFQSRRDIPISGSAVTSRRNAHFYLRNSATESSKANSTGDKRSKSPEKATSTGHPTPGSNANVASPSASPYAQTIKAEKSNTAKSTHSSDSIHHFEKRRRTSSITHAPIPLSLSEDDPLPDSLVQKSVNDGRVKRQRSESETSPSIQRHSPPATAGSQHSTSRRKDSGAVKSSMVSPNQVSQQLAQSLTPLATNNSVYPTDIADVLYEYFPLPPEDWQGPVDGVYRPHVVHHTALDDMKLKNWSRTYFAGAGEAT
ncbi:hypothetical protein KEM55_003600 [Ascosphaera atra]|nr:hypothetical protein KEM55_003600 [Ascosphaera atra]